MPFYLYSATTNGSVRTFLQGPNVSLAGNTGPLSALALKLTNGASPNKWHVTGPELVAEILRINPNLGPATDVLIDLKPAAKEVSLYRLLDVWGFSDNGWTPVALHLEALIVETPSHDPAAFKRSFTAGPNCESVAEFLYLQGATAKDTWNWGRIGGVNGALLWPDTFRYLAGELGKAIDLWANDGHPLMP